MKTYHFEPVQHRDSTWRVVRRPDGYAWPCKYATKEEAEAAIAKRMDTYSRVRHRKDKEPAPNSQPMVTVPKRGKRVVKKGNSFS